MSTYIIDTSVTVAWYLEERFSASARTWQDRLLNGKVRLLVPSFHYWEFANVLRTLVTRGEIGQDLASDIFDLHLDAPMEVAEPERRVVLSTALEYGATAYDAVFIALAVANQAPLITAERTTTGWVTKLGALIEPVR
jgi:predicted nucleic acid-binding protein